jgi:hypothetical protein
VPLDGPTPQVELKDGAWLVTLQTDYGYPPNQIVVQIDLASGDVLTVNPDLQAELNGGVVAHYVMNGTQFSVYVTDDEVIGELLAIQAGEMDPVGPVGTLSEGPGVGLHNAPWAWHLDPDSVSLEDVINNRCSEEPAFVHRSLDYWLSAVGRYCPADATLVVVQDFR